MKIKCLKYLSCISIGIILLMGVNSFAAKNGSKVGFVNLFVLMNESPQAMAAEKRLRTEFSAFKKQLSECEEDVESLDKKLKRKGRDMEKDAREHLMGTIRRKKRDCRDIKDEAKDKSSILQKEEIGEVQKLIAKIIKEVAKEKEIDLIVGPQSAIYASPKVDLTEIVMDELSNLFDNSAKKSKSTKYQ